MKFMSCLTKTYFPSISLYCALSILPYINLTMPLLFIQTDKRLNIVSIRRRKKKLVITDSFVV